MIEENTQAKEISENIVQAKEEIDQLQKLDSEGRSNINIFVHPENAFPHLRDSISGKDVSVASAKESMEEFLTMMDLLIVKIEHDMNFISNDDLLTNVANLYSNLLKFKMIFAVPLSILSGDKKDAEFFESNRLLHRDVLEKIEPGNICNKYIQICIGFMKEYFKEKVMPIMVEISSGKSDDPKTLQGLNAECSLLVGWG